MLYRSQSSLNLTEAPNCLNSHSVFFFYGDNSPISIFLFCEFAIKKTSGLFREMGYSSIWMYFYLCRYSFVPAKLGKEGAVQKDSNSVMQESSDDEIRYLKSISTSLISNPEHFLIDMLISVPGEPQLKPVFPVFLS